MNWRFERTSRKHRKLQNTEQKFIFQIGTHKSSRYQRTLFIQLIHSVVIHVARDQPIALLHISEYKPHTTHNSSIRSNEGLTLETSTFESLYGGQFTLSTQMIKPNYLFINGCHLKILSNELVFELISCQTNFYFQTNYSWANCHFLAAVLPVLGVILKWGEIVVTEACRIIKTNGNRRTR